ncbi:MAG: AMP-binding protein [Planctomycetota bacterium]
MSLMWPILRGLLMHPRRTIITDDKRSYRAIELLVGALHVAEQVKRDTASPRVGVMLPTSGAFPLALLGTWWADKAIVPLNYLMSRDDLHFVIRDADIDTVITVDPMLEFIGGEDHLPDHTHLIRLDHMPFTGVPELRWPPIHDGTDLAALLYTSGTSGRPKGVKLTHQNITTNVRDSVHHAGVTGTHGFLGVLPNFHAFGLTVLTLMPLFTGSHAVYTARFAPKKLAKLAREHKPTIFVAVPSMFAALAASKDADPADWESVSLAISGAEPLPDAIYEKCKDKLGLEILEGYGLTETSPVATWSTPAENKRHSVGKPLPHVQAYILDEKGHPLPPEQEGEIALAGPSIMDGYWFRPDLTEQVMIDIPLTPGDTYGGVHVNAFKTGDLGKIDRDGFLYITGRIKDLLIIAGENVSPREIEEELNKHPHVHASAVVGVPDESRGEVPIAFVELEESAEFDEAHLIKHLREAGLPAFKVPKAIHHLDALPRNPTGKILRRELREHPTLQPADKPEPAGAA